MSFTFVKGAALATAVVGIGLTPALAAPGVTTPATAPAKVDAASLETPNFVTMAAQTDEFERTAGKMAEKMGGPAVQKFGARMVQDHTKTTEELKAAIKKAGMAVPPPPALTQEQQQMLSQLKGKTGAAFDRAYIKQAVMTHKKALLLMEGYAAHGASKPIAMAAKGAAPIVQDHLRMAEKLEQGKPREM